MMEREIMKGVGAYTRLVAVAMEFHKNPIFGWFGYLEVINDSVGYADGLNNPTTIALWLEVSIWLGREWYPFV